MRENDILLTGLPRSGTTLLCHLLNRLPNSVALHEPMNPTSLSGKQPSAVVDAIRGFMATERQRILEEGKATSKTWGGTVPSNHLGDAGIGGRRERMIDGTELAVENVDRDDFRLYVKHPSFFTACLPFLSKEFTCFAAIRNPLSVILSWRNANMPVTKGRIPAAESFDKNLQYSLDRTHDVIDRQFYILDYFFRRYRMFLYDNIIRYEDVLSTQGKVLSRIDPGAYALQENLKSRNELAIHSDPEARRIADRLVDSDNACWGFYRRDEILSLFRG